MAIKDSWYRKKQNGGKSHLVSIIETWTYKFWHATINYNEIFCAIGFNSSDTVDQAARISNKWSSRFNDEIEVSWYNQFPNLQ